MTGVAVGAGVGDGTAVPAAGRRRRWPRRARRGRAGRVRGRSSFGRRSRRRHSVVTEVVLDRVGHFLLADGDPLLARLLQDELIVDQRIQHGHAGTGWIGRILRILSPVELNGFLILGQCDVTAIDARHRLPGGDDQGIEDARGQQTQQNDAHSRQQKHNPAVGCLVLAPAGVFFAG